MATWTLASIPWHDFDPTRVDPTCLALARSACLVEYNSHEYGRYLRQVFAGEDALGAVIDRWAEEEVQHGQALRRWCELADPHFDFPRAFAQFTDKIRLPDGTPGSVRGSRAGELLARCVVECGTSMYYSCLAHQVAEPVLKRICQRIAADEFRHYRLFLDHSRQVMAREPLGTVGRLRVVLGRMIESEDDELAYAWYCTGRQGRAYRRRPVLGAYLQASLSVLRRSEMERSLSMVMRALGFSAHRRIMGIIGMLAMRLVRVRIRSLAAAQPMAEHALPSAALVLTA